MNEWMNDDDDDDDGLNFTVWGIFIKDFHLTLWIISLDFIDGPVSQFSYFFLIFAIFLTLGKNLLQPLDYKLCNSWMSWQIVVKIAVFVNLDIFAILVTFDKPFLQPFE